MLAKAAFSDVNDLHWDNMTAVETGSKPASNEPSTTSVKDVVAIARDVAVLAVAVLFPIGYLYRWYYLDSFALPPHGNSIDLNETLTDAAVVLSNNWIFLALYVLVAVAAYRWGRFLVPARFRARPPAPDAKGPRTSSRLIVFVLIGTCGLLILGENLARLAALSAAADIKLMSVYSVVRLKSSAPTDLAALLACALKQRVVDENSDDVFVLVQPSAAASCGRYAGGLHVVRIPRSDVSFVSTAI